MNWLKMMPRMRAELFSEMGTSSYKMHSNVILLLKYPDAQIYFQYNSSHIFYVKICMTRWNELGGNRRVLALPDDLTDLKMETVMNGRSGFVLCSSFCSFWFMKNEHLHVKSQTSSPFRKTAIFFVFHLWAELHTLHDRIWSWHGWTDSLGLAFGNGASTKHWNACRIPCPK